MGRDALKLLGEFQITLKTVGPYSELPSGDAILKPSRSYQAFKKGHSVTPLGTTLPYTSRTPRSWHALKKC